MSNWSKLYTLANSIYALQPWRFMYEDEILGVRDPITNTLGFISVMGSLGEHYSLTVYLGERTLGQFLELSEAGPNASPEMVLEMSQLMLSFEEKEFLEKEDRSVMKENGISVSGKKLLPIFRSYRPGMVPWFLEETEQKSMIHYLEQFMEVVVMQNDKDLRPKLKRGGEYGCLVRDFTKTGDSIRWRNTRQEITIPQMPDIITPFDTLELGMSKSLPAGKDIYEVDFFLTLAQIREKDRRPYFPYMLMIVEERWGMVVATELLDPSDGIDQMVAKIPGLMLKIFSNGKSLPWAIHVRTRRLFDLLTPLLKDLGVKLHFQNKLKSLEMAKRSVLEYFGRR